jgi:hypothetical protein
MREYAMMRVLDAWYSHLDAEIFIDQARSVAARRRWEQLEDKAKLETDEHVFPKLTDIKEGRLRIKNKKPLVYQPRD